MSKTVVQLDSIKCNQTSEPGHDEVFLICQSDGGLPLFIPPGLWKLSTKAHPMANGDSWSPLDRDGQPYMLSFEHNLIISLWDADVNDDPTVSSYLGNVHFSPASFSSGATTQNAWVPGNTGYNASYDVTLNKKSG